MPTKRQVFRIECLVIALSLVVQFPVCAKDTVSSEVRLSKSSDKMPIYVSPQVQGYEKAKEAMDAALIEPTFKQNIDQKVTAAKEKISEVVDAALKALVPQKGDPKTGYSQKENRNHSSKFGGKEEISPALDFSMPDSSNSSITDAGILVNYSYDVVGGVPLYDRVTVLYDKNTLAVLSVTGYTTTTLNAVPDLTGMTLTGTGFYSDGTLAFQRYQSAPDADGTKTELSIRYDSYFGNVVVSFVSQTVTQPLDLTKIKLPTL